MNFFNNPLVHISNKDNVERKIKSFSPHKIQIVTDYDATVTRADGEHSWSIFEGTAAFSGGYKKEAKVLFEKNYPLEIDDSICPVEKDIIMHKWWTDCLNLLLKYGLHQSHIDEILSNNHSMEFREGFKEFFEESFGYSIPIVILSAGVANIIESFLSKQNCLTSNVHIVSNRLKFLDDGKCCGFESDIIHSHNKSENEISGDIQEQIRFKSDIILLGDSLSDIEMIDPEKRNDALNIAFVSGSKLSAISDFQNTFDIVIESAKDTYNVPCDILKEVTKNR